MLIKRIAAAVLISTTMAAAPAYAADFSFNFNGSGVSGAVQLTYGPNPNTGSPLDQSPNIVDPTGSYIVTGITGTFSDSTLGITNAAITGIVSSNPANPTPDNKLAPASFGFYPVASGIPIAGTPFSAPGFSYDNLFYPAGSPQAASDYVSHGGFVDIYGLVFTLDNGNAVNFWSNGVGPEAGTVLTYGAGVTDGTNVLDYVSGLTASVPEPASWLLMIGGFGMIGLSMRRRSRLAIA